MHKLVCIVLLMLGLTLSAQAAIKTKTIEYKDGDTKLVGTLAWDDAIKAKAPGVVVYPEWWGLTDYPKHRAEQLAALGYVAFAADMYGDGKSTQDPKEAGAWSGAVKKGPIRSRAKAALDTLAAQEQVDPSKLAAIGYCFGGTAVLELTYSGAPIVGGVTFHGGPTLPKDSDAKPIKPKLLILTGGADATIPAELLQKLRDALDAFGANWEMGYYSGAKHAFTNPDADKFGIPQIGYNKQADERSWARMKDFLAEVFAAPADKS